MWALLLRCATSQVTGILGFDWMRLLIGVILLCCWLISGHDAQDFAGGSLAPALKSRLPTPDFLNSENPTQPRVLYAFFGVIPRAIRCTWQSHYERGVLPLRKAGFGVDVFVFNLNVGDTKVDGIAMQQSEISVIPYRYFKEEQQRDVDRRIRVLCNKTRCQFGRFYQPRQTQNAIRQAYSESQIGRFLTSQSAEGEANHNETARQRYAAVVVSGPDYYLLRPIPVAEVRAAMHIVTAVYTAALLDAMGYTNGFYIGHPRPVARVLLRFLHWNEDLPTKHDYEYLLKKAFQRHGLQRRVTRVLFEKIRAPVCVAWCNNKRALCRRPEGLHPVPVRMRPGR